MSSRARFFEATSVKKSGGACRGRGADSMVKLGINITKRMKKRLGELAVERGCSRSAIIRHAILNYFEDTRECNSLIDFFEPEVEKP